MKGLLFTMVGIIASIALYVTSYLIIMIRREEKRGREE